MKKITIRYSKIYNIFIYLIVLVMVLMSKTVYFGIINRSKYQFLFYIIILIGVFLLKIKNLEHRLIVVFPFVFLFTMNLIIYYNTMNSQQINQVIGILITFILIAMVSSYVTISDFASKYIKIISIISIISLVCVTIANINQGLAYWLSQEGYDWQQAFGYSFFYTWGINGIINTRNSGPFWEPGAFQGFLLLSLLMLLYNSDNGNIKNRRFHTIINIMTILTTQSTTAYIILILLLIINIKKFNKIFMSINEQIRVLIVFFIVFGIIYFIASSDNIVNKFIGTYNDSASIRFSDLTGGWNMIKKGGVFGLGETLLRDSYRIQFGVDIDDSVGLFAMTYTYGIIFSIYYIFLLFKGLINLFYIDNLKDIIFINLVFIVLNLTEGIWFLPIYLFVIFGIREKTIINEGGE